MGQANKNWIIGHGGASHSGKSTTITKVHAAFPEQTIVLSEIMRKRTDVTSIDELRADPNRYFQVQLEIIRAKVEQEDEASKIPNKVILIDRSLADSFYYYTAYVDFKRLSLENQNAYFSFLCWIMRKCTADRYDSIMYFAPIPSTEQNDPMRPTNLDLVQKLESALIGHHTKALFPHTPLLYFCAKDESDSDTLSLYQERIQSVL